MLKITTKQIILKGSFLSVVWVETEENGIKNFSFTNR